MNLWEKLGATLARRRERHDEEWRILREITREAKRGDLWAIVILAFAIVSATIICVATIAVMTLLLSH